jgi:hypothetical protein
MPRPRRRCAVSGAGTGRRRYISAGRDVSAQHRKLPASCRMYHTACRVHPAIRRTRKLGQFLHPAVRRRRPTGRQVRHPARQMHPATRRTRKPGRCLHPAACRKRPTVRWMDHPARRKHPAARRTRKPGRFLHPASRRKHPTAHWKLHPSYRKHPASYRTRKPAGFSIQRLAGCVQRPLDASPGPLEASGGSPDAETSRFPDPTPRRKRRAVRWMHPPDRRTWKSDGFSIQRLAGSFQRPLDASPGPPEHPAARRTRKSAGFPIQRLAGCFQRVVGCFHQAGFLGSAARAGLACGYGNQASNRKSGSPFAFPR